MGLIRWIKKKHYNSCLKKADKLAQKHDLARAETVYRKILGKHDSAVVNLSIMYLTYTNIVGENLKALKSISELKQYTNENNISAYNEQVNKQISHIDSLANSFFTSKKYDSAASLIDSITSFHENDGSFIKKVHQYHAYLLFSNVIKFYNVEDAFKVTTKRNKEEATTTENSKETKSNDTSYIIIDNVHYIASENALKEIINELKYYEPDCESDINYFIDELKNKSLFTLAIKLLIPFIELSDDYKEQIINFLIETILGNDRDIPNPEKLSVICSNEDICKEAASSIFGLSKEAAQKHQFAQSVTFDNYASDYLSDDNKFNFTRCKHIFRELEPRAEAGEIKSLLVKAKDLNLTDKQISELKKDISKLAIKTAPQKGIEICRLFLNEKEFDNIYIEQAENQASTDSSIINTEELLTIIRNNTNEDSFVDTLTPFVKYIPEYSDLFIDSAIDKIVRHKSVELLQTYWKVKKDETYFNTLISPSSALSKETAGFVIINNELFLHDSHMLSSFLKAIDSLNDDIYSYKCAESLYQNDFEVLDYILEKTESRCEKLDDDESINLIDHTLEVIDYLNIHQSDWIALFIKKRNIQKKSTTTISQRIRFYSDTIKTIINSCVDFKGIKEPSYYQLWEEYVNIILKKSESQPRDKAINDLTEVRGLLNNYCKSNDTYISILKTLTNRILKLRWETGKEAEEDCDYDEAISQYQDISNEDDSCYSIKAEFRCLICHIKDGRIYENIGNDIKCVLENKSYNALKDDLAYRYACFLIKATRPAEAEDILNNYIQDSDLKDICTKIFIKESEHYLQDFNEKFNAVANESMPLEDAISFYEQFANYQNIISRSLPDTTNKFVVYRRYLVNYIVKTYFNEGKYSLAFKGLMKLYPHFYEDDTRLRNVAIAALGTVEENLEDLDEDIYKSAISIWLSAIYHDRLFVKSLDYTSWDDSYSFTLDGSLGETSDNDYEELPDNVNFDSPTDNQNIAIADVQNNLIVRMETFIRNNRPNLETFFNSEKEALDNLIALRLDEDCIIAAPFYAKHHSRILESIKDSFDLELAQEYRNKEDVLCLGVKYGFEGGEYSDYLEAETCSENCKTSLSETVAELKAQLKNLSKVQKYEKLYGSLKAFFSSKMNEAIKEEMDYIPFINLYEVVCDAFNDNTMSLTFSNYANLQIIHQLNDEDMELREGVELMTRIYNVSKNDFQVEKNLHGMIGGLAKDVELYGNQADKNTLTKVLNITSGEFKEDVAEGILSAIIDKVNNNDLDKSAALQKVYSLYIHNCNSNRICENLVILCDMCIMEDIIGQSLDSLKVKDTLDKLNNNKSTTFKGCAKKLQTEYIKLWSKLPSSTQLALRGMSTSSYLTSQGYALKDGLDYYKKLSGYNPGLFGL